VSIFLAYLLVGCDTTLHLRQGQVLIHKKPAFQGNVYLKKENLEVGVKTHPNKRILLVKVYLDLYNLGTTIEQSQSLLKKIYLQLDTNARYEKGVVKWLKQTVGEPPALVDSIQLQEDVSNLTNIYYASGFLNACVKYRVLAHRHNPYKGDVVFDIQENKPFIIQQIDYVCENKMVSDLVLRDTIHSLLHVGDIYKEATLTEERIRISNHMRNMGFFTFEPNRISYLVDTTGVRAGKQLLGLTVFIPDSIEKYRIGKIKVRLSPPSNFIEYDWEDSTKINLVEKDYNSVLDSQKISFVSTAYVLRHVNLEDIVHCVFIRTGELYSLQTSQTTVRAVQNLGIFNIVNILYTPNDSNQTIDVLLEASMANRYDMRVGLEVFESEDRQLNTNYPGFGGNYRFIDRNLFGGGEQLSSQANGSVNLYFPDPDKREAQLFYRYGIKSTFTVPRFLLLPELNRKLYSRQPSTIFNLSIT